jgi:hypothetical protein
MYLEAHFMLCSALTPCLAHTTAPAAVSHRQQYTAATAAAAAAAAAANNSNQLSFSDSTP